VVFSRDAKQGFTSPRRPPLRLALLANAIHVQRTQTLDIPVQGVCSRSVNVKVAALSGQFVQIEHVCRVVCRGQAVGGLQDGDPFVQVDLAPIDLSQPVDRESAAIRLFDVPVRHPKPRTDLFP